MLRFILLCLFCTLIAMSAYAERKIIRNVQPSPNLVMQLVRSMGGTVIKSLRYNGDLVVELPDGLNTAQIFSMNAMGLKIEKDVLHKLSMACNRPKPDNPIPNPEPPSQITPWGITRVESQGAWPKTKGKGQKACVVDTGVQNHSDLGENLGELMSFVSSEGPFDEHGHGTHVAGTISALDNAIGVVGVAPEATIISAKVLSKEGFGWASDIADGIMWCIRKKANVINMSLGAAEASEIIHEAIKVAKSAGIYIVAAAGNEGDPTGYPAAFAEVIAVSASDSRDQLAGFSNRGNIDFMAPGVGIKSTILNNKYDNYSGTSMAAPHVTGVVLLMISAGKTKLVGRNVGLPPELQGQGLISAKLSTN